MELNYAQIAAKGFPKPIQRVYLLHGTDDALKREALKRLTEPLLDPSFADFDRETREISPTGGGATDESLAASDPRLGGRGADGVGAARGDRRGRAAAGQGGSGRAGGGSGKAGGAVVPGAGRRRAGVRCGQGQG